MIVALVAYAGQIERKAVLQAMLSRPIVTGAILGFLLGDLPSGLLLGVLLELLWLGGINIGANLPDNEVVGAGAVVGAAIIASGSQPVTPELATLAVVLLSPLARVGRHMDLAVERRNKALLERVENQLSSKGTCSLGPIVILGLVSSALFSPLLTVGGAALGGLFLPVIVENLPSGALHGLAAAFPVLLAACAAASLASIRVDRAKALGLASAGLTLVVTLSYVLGTGS